MCYKLNVFKNLCLFLSAGSAKYNNLFFTLWHVFCHVPSNQTPKPSPLNHYRIYLLPSVSHMSQYGFPYHLLLKSE